MRCGEARQAVRLSRRTVQRRGQRKEGTLDGALLVAQGDNWIDLHGTTCWDVAGDECDGD
jgi:hypothetical protein